MRKKTSAQELDLLIQQPEITIEFKEARSQFGRDDVLKYVVALANERGGKLVLGVSDKKPRRVVGSRAFEGNESLEKEILDRVGIRIEIEDVDHPNGRVVIFHIPGRPLGRAYSIGGRHLMRSGDSVVPMPDDHLRAIFAETEPDFSSLVCQSSSIDDLSPEAIESFRKKWHKRSGNANLVTFSDKLLLQNAELVEGDSVTNAALILLAKTEILRRIYPQCEIIFEYRLQEVAGPANERLEIRSCAIEAIETLWNAINKRNDLQSIQDGLLVRQVQTFNEAVVREALLNAITHRDYSMLGPIFVVQYPRKLVVKSPGGFPRGVTIKNLIDQHIPRNRRLAETFERVGFVEKAGQGVDRMFELAIREGKNTPDYGQSDEHQIILAVEGELIHPDLVRFIESVGEKTGYSFSTVELLALAAIHGGARGTEKYPDVASKLCEKQIIERVGKGRGTRYILSKAFYTFVGRKGTYTRTKRLDRDTNKALLLKHLNDNSQAGSPLRELMQVLPQLTKDEVRTLLRELRSDRKVVSHGRGQKGRWFPFSKVENEN